MFSKSPSYQVKPFAVELVSRHVELPNPFVDLSCQVIKESLGHKFFNSVDWVDGRVGHRDKRAKCWVG